MLKECRNRGGCYVCAGGCNVCAGGCNEGEKDSEDVKDMMRGWTDE
jgi:hypothetical protein